MNKLHFQDVSEYGVVYICWILFSSRCKPHHILIRNPIQFGLIVDYLSVGLSFRAVAKVILMTKEWTGMVSIGKVSEGKVTAIAQVVCSHSLELISYLLMMCWTFSLAMDMSTHMSTSYLDIQI